MKWAVRRPVAALAAACAAGCAEPAAVRYVAPSFYAQAPARIAVLPFDNQSVDMAGPELLRRLVDSGLRGRGYDPWPLERVDDVLRSIGVTDGGQLRAVTPQRVGQVLGTDGLFYGDVEEFAFMNVGFVLRRIVRLRLRFIQAASGARLWEDAGEGLTEFFTLDKKEAWRAFVEGLADRELQNIFRAPLMPEAREAVRRLLVDLPERRVSSGSK